MVVFEDIGNDAIQVDVDGYGVIQYFGKLTNDLMLEINTNINIALKKYSKLTTHNCALIGYDLELLPTKKFDCPRNGFFYQCKLVIIFKKPVPKASAFSLTPTIELITSTILDEIFITND